MIWMKEDADDNTGGLYKWTMDALFGRRISPSRRFREISQDDTNHKLGSKLKGRRWNGADFEPRTRSTSASFDRSFLQRYELLQDEDEKDLMRPVPSPIGGSTAPNGNKLHASVLKDDIDSTDTFSGRKQRRGVGGANRRLDDESLKFQVPLRNDPLISKLFGKEAPPVSTALPGKFPSPTKNNASSPQRHSPSKASPLIAPSRNYTDEYLQLLEELDMNGQSLKQLQRGIQQKQNDQDLHESNYRQKYHVIRQELITELKQSKRLYDNYYKLYERYKRLKASSGDVPQLTQRVRDLEAQVVDASIEKAAEIRKLNETIFQLEFKQQEIQATHDREKIRYQSRIAELESILKSRIPLSKGDGFSQSREYKRPISPPNIN